jgi:chemotaxis protein MotB
MDTYGDLVTLLLCFFVLLFSFSSVDAKKWEALVGAFSGSTAIAIPGLSPEQVIEKPIELIARTAGELIMSDPAGSENPGDVGEHENMEAYQNWLVLQERISDFLAANHMTIQMIGDRDRFTVTLRVGSNVFFDSGDASLRTEALPVLDQLAEVLAENEDRYVMVTIEGHTDNVPINTDRYPSNWELSSFRAVNTLHYIADKKLIDPDKLSAMGYSEYHPAETNDTEAGKAANRRVDFVIQGVTEFN